MSLDVANVDRINVKVADLDQVLIDGKPASDYTGAIVKFYNKYQDLFKAYTDARNIITGNPSAEELKAAVATAREAKTQMMALAKAAPWSPQEFGRKVVEAAACSPSDELWCALALGIGQHWISEAKLDETHEAFIADLRQINSMDGASLHIMLSVLQNKLASTNRSLAMGHISDIKVNQNAAKKMAEGISALRTLMNKVEGKGGVSEDEAKKAMLTAQAVCKEFGINVDLGSFTKPDNATLTEIMKWSANYPKKENVQLALDMLKDKQEQCGTDVQQQMVLVNDYVGKYNSFTQGSTTTISKANDVLAQILQGR